MAKPHPFAESGLIVPPTHTPGKALPIPGGGVNRLQTPMSRGLSSRIINQMQRNIVRLGTPEEEGGLATPEDIESGAGWYPKGQEHAARIGAMLGGTSRHGAALISALSPQTEWELNLIKAHDLALHGRPTYEKAGWSSKTVGGQSADQRQNKAEKVIATARQGQDPTHLFDPRLKTGNFLENLYDPTNPHFVTIDTHAHNAAVASRTSSDRTGLSSVGRYGMFSTAYQGAAHQLGVVPNEMQARAWVAWKRMNPAPQPGASFDDYLKSIGHYDRYYGM